MDMVSVAGYVLLGMVAMGIWLNWEEKGRRRKCRNGCDPKHSVVLSDGGNCRKVKCLRCGWVHLDGRPTKKC